MSAFVPVPWLQWQRFRITGVIRRQGTDAPLPGLVVCAYDQDVLKDDYLGEALTDAEGRFEIRFTDADFKDLVETRPDLYLRVFRADDRVPIHDTSWTVRTDASNDEFFDIEIADA